MPKLCILYFAGKAGLYNIKKYYPSFYEEKMHKRSLLFTNIINQIIPQDYLKCESVFGGNV